MSWTARRNGKESISVPGPDPRLFGPSGYVTLFFVRIRIWILQSDSYLDPSIRKQKRKKKKEKPDFDRIVASK
jgi:hypothetical protein